MRWMCSAVGPREAPRAGRWPRERSESSPGCMWRWGSQRSGFQEDSVAKEDRGFASVDRVKQREIASKGGKAAHQKGTAHEWTSEEAREAGRKGGMASHRRRKEMMDGTTGTGTETGSLDSQTPTERSGGDDQNEQIR